MQSFKKDVDQGDSSELCEELKKQDKTLLNKIRSILQLYNGEDRKFDQKSKIEHRGTPVD
jgi:hypothetical protein